MDISENSPPPSPPPPHQQFDGDPEQIQLQQSNQTDSSSAGSAKRIRLEIKTEPTTPHQLPTDMQSWQETKTTIKERTSCLVNSERLSDVTFLVGANETPIYGHKTILSAGSPYFEKLFYGPMAAVPDMQIKIPDIDAEVFLTFLKYLYTDEFDTTMDDVDTMLLLKPAKVYIVPHLAVKCTELLLERMSPENILLIYNRALIFDESKLAEFCLRFLDRQIDKVIATENFLDIDQPTLCTLLERENLRVEECTLFKGVFKWTETECMRKGIEVTTSNRREVLGRALYLIRFPTMTKEEFSIEVVPTNILGKDEVIGIFMNLCITSDLEQYRPETPFRTEKRVFRPKLHYLNRFSDVLSKVLTVSTNTFGSSSDVLYSSKIKVRVDQRIFIHGLGVYGISSPIPLIRFNATASLCKGPTLYNCKTLDGSGRSYDFRMPFQVMFDKPVEILPDEEYMLTAVLKIVRDTAPNNGPSIFPFGSHYGPNVNIDSYYGTKGHSQIKMTCLDGVVVNFTFMVPAVFHVGESFNVGQIPQIIFSV